MIKQEENDSLHTSCNVTDSVIMKNLLWVLHSILQTNLYTCISIASMARKAIPVTGELVRIIYDNIYFMVREIFFFYPYESIGG